MTGRPAVEYSLHNFPETGEVTVVQWDEAKQNFSVYLALRGNQLNLSGTYYGALESGAHAPYCGPWPPDRKLPVKHASFVVQVADGRMSLAAEYVDGTTCTLPNVALAPYDSFIDRDGYVRAVFDQAATARCPSFRVA